MLQNNATAIRWVEKGLLPDPFVRHGIRRLLKDRLTELRSGDSAAAAEQTQVFLERIRSAPLALVPDKANEQHYEVPAEFFGKVLGPHRKYSSGLWSAETQTLAQAEEAALEETCAHAGLRDGQHILELGCGWGSLTLWMADRYPLSRITALSNSHSQREYIEAQAMQRGLRNVQVLTCDFNVFDTAQRFDRIVSVEMFEHLRNWPRAFAQVARWLEDDGRFFMHVFAHREAPYPFVARDASDWMSQHFFSGGMMPSDDLALHCQDDLRLMRRWRWEGTHYARTARAWLDNMDKHGTALQPLFARVYGSSAGTWWTRWRLFFLAVEELFAYGAGQQWWVSHYLFEKRSAASRSPAA
ncbi:SAM-dependent methyltransferase [Paracidovorax konjaci]|uniref:Cyclopropane-fatty-acyl-phospholipid synthase n=1 Tax=Paracidovorax konjaci TaxID=32040 RepID=A0A1I1XTW7_9BURK|nr:cyclopropane-fatty-acyl-phospholipid synthase family protein [Paracidovorax konjaci]SFE10681.1 cyclopropane-fatty-acyl-phospholipid synthase [Paracidovorax konjaci]